MFVSEQKVGGALSYTVLHTHVQLIVTLHHCYNTHRNRPFNQLKMRLLAHLCLVVHCLPDQGSVGVLPRLIRQGLTVTVRLATDLSLGLSR